MAVPLWPMEEGERNGVMEFIVSFWEEEIHAPCRAVLQEVPNSPLNVDVRRSQSVISKTTRPKIWPNILEETSSIFDMTLDDYMPSAQMTQRMKSLRHAV